MSTPIAPAIPAALNAPQPFRDSLRDLRASLETVHSLDRAILPLCALLALLDALLPFIGIYISAQVVERLMLGVTLRAALTFALPGTGIAFVLTALRAWVSCRRNERNFRAFWRYKMRTGLKTLAMDYPQLDSPARRDLRQRMHEDNSWGSGISSIFHLFHSLTTHLLAIITALALALPVFTASGAFQRPVTAAYFAALLLVTVVSILFLSNRSKRLFALMNLTSDSKRIFSHMAFDNQNPVRQGKDVRLYHALPLFRQKLTLGAIHGELGELHARIYGQRGTATGFTRGFIEGGSYLLVAYLAVTGGLSMGGLLLTAAALYRFSDAISSFVITFESLVIAARRTLSTLAYQAYPDCLYKGTLPVEKRQDHEYDIEFRDVSFQYPGSEAYALRHVNLRLRVGEKLAVVGLNGSGKTTLIKLLCRLYDPTEGEITLNRIDIRKYSYEEYIALFSVVFQDFKLFAFPLGQNVAASMDVDIPRATQALVEAGLAARLETLPQALDTALYKGFDKDGVEISGGEAQKVAIARALYQDAPFIVLDEPTAALDPIAEYDIYTRFDTLVHGRTAVYISHRLSSCRFCDDIVVFSGGQVVQRGNHETLLADAGGLYEKLWQAQAAYYA